MFGEFLETRYILRVSCEFLCLFVLYFDIAEEIHLVLDMNILND